MEKAFEHMTEETGSRNVAAFIAGSWGSMSSDREENSLEYY